MIKIKPSLCPYIFLEQKYKERKYYTKMKDIAKRRSHFSIDVEKFYHITYFGQAPTRLQKLKCWVLSFGLHCITVYRFGQWADGLFRKNPVFGCLPYFIYHLFNYQMRLFHHVEVRARTNIGPGFFMGHAQNVMIAMTTIGGNCSINHNVTIGQDLAAADRAVPVIGNDVWIGTGSIITGGITIGDGATIAAGSVISHNVPERCLVGGNPARVILRNYDNGKLLMYASTGRDAHPAPARDDGRKDETEHPVDSDIKDGSAYETRS